MNSVAIYVSLPECSIRVLQCTCFIPYINVDMSEQKSAMFAHKTEVHLMPQLIATLITIYCYCLHRLTSTDQIFQSDFYLLCKFIAAEMVSIVGCKLAVRIDIAPTVGTSLFRPCSGVLAHRGYL